MDSTHNLLTTHSIRFAARAIHHGFKLARTYLIMSNSCISTFITLHRVEMYLSLGRHLFRILARAVRVVYDIALRGV